jgi:hypothetical protein
MAFNYSGAALPIYAARDVAVTQRPNSTAILAIDSEDRYKTYAESRQVGPLGATNRSPYDFRINKAESIMNGFFTRIAVTEVCFPWVIPNINRKTNTIIVNYNVGAGNQTALITVPIGFYTPSALASTIQTLVRLINVGLNLFTMTYGIGVAGNLPVFEYATNNANTIGFSPTVPDPTLNQSATTKQLFDILGFNVGNSLLTTGFSGGLTYCQATRYVDIVCTQLTNNQALKDTMTQEVSRTTLCRLYFGDPNGAQSTVAAASSTFCPTGCAPFTIYRDFVTPKQIAWMPDAPIGGFLQFQVFDDNGDLLSESDSFSTGANRTDWSMTVLVTEN